MKALLIKDLKLMKNLKNFFVVMAIMIVAFSVFYTDSSFVLTYMVVFVATMSVSSISYDTCENGEAFLFTLPVSRKGYVREKYVLSLLLLGTAMIVFTAFSCVLGVVKGSEPGNDFWGTVVVTFFVAVFFVAYMMPIQLKFGNEQRNIVVILTVGVAMLVAILASEAFQIGAFNGVMESLGDLVREHKGETLVASACALAIFMAVSYKISVRIMEKKEF